MLYLPTDGRIGAQQIPPTQVDLPGQAAIASQVLPSRGSEPAGHVGLVTGGKTATGGATSGTRIFGGLTSGRGCGRIAGGNSGSGGITGCDFTGGGLATGIIFISDGAEIYW